MISFKRVRTGACYVYDPMPIDACDPNMPAWLKRGALVKVTQPYGCPPNGTMGHCFVEPTGLLTKGLQLVCTNSLKSVKDWKKHVNALKKSKT